MQVSSDTAATAAAAAAAVVLDNPHLHVLEGMRYCLQLSNSMHSNVPTDTTAAAAAAAVV
jgi:hypothetical protein